MIIKRQTTSTCEQNAAEERAAAESAQAASKDKRKRKEKQGFSSRLAFAFALVAAFTAVLGGVLSFVVWNYQFDRYIRSNLEAIADALGTASSYVYSQYGGWNFNTFSNIPQVGSQTDVVVQIIDNKGSVIYDEATLRSHIAYMRQQQAQGIDASTEDTRAINPNDISVHAHPTGEVVTCPIIVNEKKVGTVRVWAYGNNSLLTERDLTLRSSSMAALAVAALIAIIVASIAGTLYSRSISKPLDKITKAAQSIRKGQLDARAGLEGEDEIAQLGSTFDQMADSVEADRELERRLTSDVAHELRTPLMAIQATVEAMEDGILPPDERHLGTIGNETRRLARLTNAILELSRIENGSLPFSFAPLDLADPVRSAIDAQAALFDLGSLTLKTELTEGLMVNGDRDRLQQAVGNLLSNAARYTQEGGTVIARVYADGDVAVAEVEDNGIGISEEDFDKMFRRFWRADEARARQTGGAGVGLAIAKEIVDRHDGCIVVSSEQGVGTTFSIRIPRM